MMRAEEEDPRKVPEPTGSDRVEADLVGFEQVQPEHKPYWLYKFRVRITPAAWAARSEAEGGAGGTSAARAAGDDDVSSELVHVFSERFSLLRDVHLQLGETLDVSAPFPPRRLGRCGEAEAKERAAALLAWLQHVVNSPPAMRSDILGRGIRMDGKFRDRLRRVCCLMDAGGLGARCHDAIG